MENERRTEYNVDMRPEEDFLSDILSASQIRATDTYETPPQIIWIDNSTIATLGNFSASTGKAKSKKTFNVSAIVAASLAGKQVLNYRAHLRKVNARFCTWTRSRAASIVIMYWNASCGLPDCPLQPTVKTSTLFACANTLRPYALGSSTTPYVKEKDTDLLSSTVSVT